MGRGVVGILEKLGIGLVPFSPLGEGFLTGRIDETTTFDSGDFVNAVPRFSPDNRRANQAGGIAGGHRRTQAGEDQCTTG